MIFTSFSMVEKTMFVLLTKTLEDSEGVCPNGYYEGEILSGDYAAGDSDYRDMWAHGAGKMTLTLGNGVVEVYDGTWDVGQFHGRGRFTTTAIDGSVTTAMGIWCSGTFVSGDK